MKIAFCLLLLVAVASAQFSQFFRNPFAPRGRPQQPQRRPPPRSQSSGRGGGVPVDNTIGSTQYHYSWRHTGGAKYTFGQAVGYCRSLGSGWDGISITDGRVDSMVSSALQRERQEYIWTSGQRSGSGWRWASGGFTPLNWSHTGGARRAQPDNREGNESCLAVLNNFYGDGVKWHDVSCHHQKPIICQRG